MKKVWIAAIMAAGMMILAGCGPKEIDPMEKFREGYESTATAETVTQEIEVLRGKLAVYEYEKAYEKNADGYAMRTTEKRLNKIDAETEEAYSVETEESEVGAAETFVPALTLDGSMFVSDYELTETTLRAKIAEGKADEVFGIAESQAEMEDVVLTLTLEEAGLTELTVAFRSGNYTVSILITYSY